MLQAIAMIGGGFVGGALLAAAAFKVSDALESLLDEAFGDYPNVPEGLTAGRGETAGRGAAAAADRRAKPRRTHGNREA